METSGYPEELAQLRTEIICTGEESELEWLAEQVRNRLIHKEERAYVYKLVGDIRKKQGQIKSAFENYRKRWIMQNLLMSGRSCTD